MKKPPVDLGQMHISRYWGKRSHIEKFIRYWGTTFVGSTEVLNPIKVYYRKGGQPDPNTDKLAKLLGLGDSLTSQDMKHIERAWLFLNQTKLSSDLASSIRKEEIAYFLSNVETKDFVVYVSDPSPTLYGSNAVHVTTSIPSGSTLTEVIKAQYQTLWGNYRLSTNVTGTDALMARYALFSTEVNATVSKVDSGFRTVQVSVTDSSDSTYYVPLVVPAVRIFLRLPDTFTVSPTADIVSRILADTAVENPTGANISQTLSDVSGIIQRTYTPADTDPYDDEPTRESWSAPYNATMWIPNPEIEPPRSVNYPGLLLKVSALRDGVISIDDRVRFTSVLIDSGYEEEEDKDHFLHALEMMVIIIVVAIASYFTGGAAAAAYGPLVAAATAITTFALMLNIATAIQVAVGDDIGASKTAALSKTIGPLVQVAQVVAIVGSVYRGVVKAALENATKEAIQAGVQQSLGSVLEDVLANVVDAVYNEITTASASELTSYGMQVATYGSNLYYKNRLAELKDGLASQSKVLAEQAAALEATKQSDMAKVFQKSFANLLQNDWSDYAYDTPYEPTRPVMHVGNIQATTVIAMLQG